MEMEMSGESLAVVGMMEPALRAMTRRTTPWGTWEELMLAGAVLRHGTADWAPVAAELRRRFPYPFTPQECEAKYEDVQERFSFSGFDAWFEELRRRRVEELRRELEKSEDSIGSLQSKLESLKAERESDQSTDYNSGHTESPYPTENTEGTDLSSKEPSNDRSSAGSFIEEARSIWSPEPQIADSASGQDISLEDSKDSVWNMFGASGDAVVVPGNLRRKRGARKRRFHNDTKEWSIDVSNSAGSVDVNREEAKGSSFRHTGPSKQVPHSEDSARHVSQDLEGILDAIMKHKGVSLFCRQLESQKKARYRKMIRRHVDFQTIKSRIGDGSISSTREVLRDLLLLSNNTLLFYPKHSREHKAAFILRELVSKRLRKDRSPDKSCNITGNEDIKMVIKPEASEPCGHKTTGNEVKPGSVITTTKKTGNSKKAMGAGNAPTTSPTKKRRVGRPAKSRSHQPPKESPLKGRKAKR